MQMVGHEQHEPAVPLEVFVIESCCLEHGIAQASAAKLVGAA